MLGVLGVSSPVGVLVLVLYAGVRVVTKLEVDFSSSASLRFRILGEKAIVRLGG